MKLPEGPPRAARRVLHVSVQLYKESTGQMPVQEDIKNAFEKLRSPVLKNVI